MIYDISFDRIGRRRDVPPLEVTVKAADEWRAGNVVAEKVYRYAGKYLASRGYEVDVDLEKGTGYIFTGQPAGDFTVTAREPAPAVTQVPPGTPMPQHREVTGYEDPR